MAERDELLKRLVVTADDYATQISHQLEMPAMVVLMAPLSDGWWTAYASHAYSPLNLEAAVLALAKAHGAKLRSPEHNCRCDECTAMATRMETVAAVIEAAGVHGPKAPQQ